MKFITILFFIAGFSVVANGQKYMTQSGTIKFFSETSLENIEAINNQVSSIINFENGEMAFSLLMKAFTFEKALMQEHFNEKYVESSKYPKSTFKGSIQDFGTLALSSSPQEVLVKGTLSIHGVSKEVETRATLSQKGDGIIGQCKFKIMPVDYNIEVPSAVRDNIAKEIEITVDLAYDKI